MTSFTIYPAIERDPGWRTLAPVIAPPLVTTSLGILYPRRRQQSLRIERVELPAGRVTIGRAGDIAIEDAFLGERHAELVPHRDGLRIRDLDTTNGTFVNDRSIREEVLHAGDILMLGQQRVWFRHTLAATPWPAQAQALLDQIRAAPSDDAPRLVLADLLSELGDPRGEFIARQLAGAPAVPPLACAGPFVTPVHHWTFHRGFIDAIYVDDLAEAAPLRAAHPFAEIRLALPLTQLE